MTEMRMFRKEDFKGVFYAHRGLYNNLNGIPENSMPAFRAAAERGYGVELDVQLSSDGQVVVFHDDTLDRVCGVKGEVCGFSLDELRGMRLLQTKETIPLFTEVLSTLRQGAGPLIVELKSGKRNDELCGKTLEILRGYSGIWCVESFDPWIVLWFRRNAPGAIRGQLAMPYGHYSPKTSAVVRRMLSGCRFSFLNRPDFIAYMVGSRPGSVLRKRRKGTLLIGWTSHDAERDAKENDGVIFENCAPPTRYNPD